MPRLEKLDTFGLFEKAQEISGGYGFWGHSLLDPEPYSAEELAEDPEGASWRELGEPEEYVEAWVNALRSLGWPDADIIFYGDWKDGRHIADAGVGQTPEQFEATVKKDARPLTEVQAENEEQYGEPYLRAMGLNDEEIRMRLGDELETQEEHVEQTMPEEGEEPEIDKGPGPGKTSGLRTLGDTDKLAQRIAKGMKRRAVKKIAALSDMSIEELSEAAMSNEVAIAGGQGDAGVGAQLEAEFERRSTGGEKVPASREEAFEMFPRLRKEYAESFEQMGSLADRRGDWMRGGDTVRTAGTTFQGLRMPDPEVGWTVAGPDGLTGTVVAADDKGVFVELEGVVPEDVLDRYDEYRLEITRRYGEDTPAEGVYRIRAGDGFGWGGWQLFDADQNYIKPYVQGSLKRHGEGAGLEDLMDDIKFDVGYYMELDPDADEQDIIGYVLDEDSRTRTRLYGVVALNVREAFGRLGEGK